MRKRNAVRVDAKDYAKFEYTPFFKGNVESPEYPTTYKIGDVVVISEKDENEEEDVKRIGVVLGCIDEQSQDLRTDMSGMVAYQDLEAYDPKKHKDIPILADLKEDLIKRGYIKIHNYNKNG